MPKGKRSTDIKGYNEEPSWESEIEKYEPSVRKIDTVRFCSPFFVVGCHWIPTTTGKKFVKWCPKFDSDAEALIPERQCPVCDDFSHLIRLDRKVVGYLISRKLQEAGDPDYIKMYILPAVSISISLKTIAEMNEGLGAEDEECGVNIGLKFNPKAKGGSMYELQRAGERSPLTKRELRHISNMTPLEEIIPDFGDPDVHAQYWQSMFDSMVRNKYYMKQIKDVRPGMRNPWPCFEASAEGRPWHEFPELVRYEQNKDRDDSIPEDDAVDVKSRSRRQRDDDEDEQPRRSNKSRQVDDDDEDNHDEDEKPRKKKQPKPECFGTFDGAAKECRSCTLRKDCSYKTVNSEGPGGDIPF